MDRWSAFFEVLLEGFGILYGRTVLLMVERSKIINVLMIGCPIKMLIFTASGQCVFSKSFFQINLTQSPFSVQLK